MSVMSIEHSTISVKGKPVRVPSASIEGRRVVTCGRFIRMASVAHEDLIEGETVKDPAVFISMLKKSGLKADLFTYTQRLPDTQPKANYPIEWVTAAAIPITNFTHWLKERAEYSTRKAVSRAQKLGVVVREVELSDDFVAAIAPIYNEVPVRQGRAFWHYGKDLEAIKEELATFLDRSIFLGAYYEDVLIGFIKMTWVGSVGTLTLILSMRQHFDKKPNNALIAEALKVCEARGMTYMTYGNYVYNDPDSTLTGFKRRNGFEPIPLPRYLIPLNLKGWIVLKFGLHRSVAEIAPKPLLTLYLKARKLWSEYRSKEKAVAHSAQA